MSKQKIVLLTGTPGTGKTTIAEELNEEFNVLNLTEFIKEKNLGKKEEEIEVDIEELSEAVSQEISDTSEDILVEGHLAHHLNGDYCVVLRTRPDVLKERLKNRDYSEAKINENIEAEKMDLILSESVSQHNSVLEIDNTSKDIENVVKEIKEGIEENKDLKGQVDWSDYI